MMSPVDVRGLTLAHGQGRSGRRLPGRPIAAQTQALLKAYIAGQGDAAVLASKMANTIDSNKELQATYLPNRPQVIRLADEARNRGRAVIKGSMNENGS